jgi:hypothetical protein
MKKLNKFLVSYVVTCCVFFTSSVKASDELDVSKPSSNLSGWEKSIQDRGYQVTGGEMGITPDGKPYGRLTFSSPPEPPKPPTRLGQATDLLHTTNEAINVVKALGSFFSGSSPSPEDILRQKMRDGMSTSGHECLGRVGDLSQCLPFRVQPGKFKYGADDKFDEESTTNNVRRLCGNGVHPWCRFDVRNSNLVSEDPIQKNKTLRGYYNCVSPFDGRVISTHHVVFAEYSEAFLSCIDKDRSIFGSN